MSLVSPSFLRIRPLTPPHDTDSDIELALQFLRDDVLSPHRVTPPSSSPLRSSPTRSKRVGFHPTPTILATPGRRNDRVLKPKSILKTSSPLPADDRGLDQSDVLKMLDSAMQHLAGMSKESRLDAYLAINNALSAYDDMPSLDQWRHHIDSLQQFVSRDIRIRELDTVDTNIVIQAIKLATYMIGDERIILSSDFQSVMLDRAATGLSDSSKPIARVCLGFLSQQKLPAVLLTAFRVERIVAAMQVESHSRSVIVARLITCRRLIEQAPSAMLSGPVWLSHVLSGMLSEVTEIRHNAIDLAIQVAMCFGRHAQITEALHDLLETQGEGTIFFEHFTLSLAKMLTTGARLDVPKIWTAIVLMHRSRRYPIHTWRRFGLWLLVLQQCMNAADLAIRQQANIAWRKLIYVVQPDSKTPERIHRLIKEPIRRGFEKNGPLGQQRRRDALDSYYNLLHYALRPGQHADLDCAWDNYVEMLSPMIAASSKGRAIASAVLTGLFTPNTGSWNSEAVFGDAIKPQDLPYLDPRWVRLRIERVARLIKEIVVRTDIGDSLYAGALALWDLMLKSMLAAGAQEVLLSMDKKTAIIKLLEVLGKTSPVDLLSHTLCQVECSERFIGLTKEALVVDLYSESFSPLGWLLLSYEQPTCLAVVKTLMGSTPTICLITAAKELEDTYGWRTLARAFVEVINEVLEDDAICAAEILLDTCPEGGPPESHLLMQELTQYLQRLKGQPVDKLSTGLQGQLLAVPSTEVRTRTRQDDSQVEFNPITSDHNVDSQLFTDRQREVRDRQHEDTVQYPALSSPSSSPVNLALPSSAFQSSAGRPHDRPEDQLRREAEEADELADQLEEQVDELSDQLEEQVDELGEDADQQDMHPSAEAASVREDEEIGHVSPHVDACLGNDRTSKRGEVQDGSQAGLAASQSHHTRTRRRSSRLETPSQQSIDKARSSRSRSRKATGDIPSQQAASRKRKPKESPSVAKRARLEENIGDLIVVSQPSPKDPPSPRNILGRLKVVLSDLRSSVLPEVSERDFDNVLFELRQAAHEAGRRGRG